MEPHSPELLAYIAGIIDGEGCININKARFPLQPQLSDRYTAILTVGNTARPLIELLMSTFGGRVDTRPATDRHKEFYVWSIRGPRACAVLHQVRRFLVLKRHQCDLLIEFVENFRSYKGGPRTRRIAPDELARRERIHAAIKKLNRPGPPD